MPKSNESWRSWTAEKKQRLLGTLRANRLTSASLPVPHAKQAEFIKHPAKRKVVRAGRRSGKTVGVATLAVTQFLAGKRVLYAAPTQDQLERFWLTVTRALETAIQAGIYYKNETKHLIE
jgi:hypothetical protein